jgi:hypothetical protein
LYPLISMRLSIPAPHPGDVVAELGAKVLTYGLNESASVILSRTPRTSHPDQA